MTTASDLPETAAWRHHGLRDGFEVVFLARHSEGYRFEGTAVAAEEGETWVVGYVIAVDTDWITRSARVVGSSPSGRYDLALDGDGAGRWRVNAEPAPQFDGCLDIDLEASALTNSLPVHRLGLAIGESAEPPAAYVCAADLAVERLEQRYRRLPDHSSGACYGYEAPAFEFECRLSYDRYGLIVDYPGIATRAA